jgi:nucleoside-diphosphate-sugar epimerase
MNKSILITGATGVMGRELVPTLYSTSDAELVLLVHKKGADENLPDFLQKYFGLYPSKRIRVVQGDISREDLGLTRCDRWRLKKSVTHVLHSAANTRFGQGIEEARHSNVDGTQHVAAFASECPSLHLFGHVSTAYVSGKRTGRIREDELYHDRGFLNAYEQSKYEAECYIRSLEHRMPVAIFRPSIVLGDSRTGVVNKMDAPHQTMRLVYTGIASALPGDPDYPINFIPNDFAAAAISRLLLSDSSPGCTYHIAAGPERTMVLSEFVHVLCESFASIDPTWRSRHDGEPTVINVSDADSAAPLAENKGGFRVMKMLKSLQQLDYPKTFDRGNVIDAIPEYDEKLPDPREYLSKVVRYCLASHWGRYAA